MMPMIARFQFWICTTFGSLPFAALIASAVAVALIL